MDWAFSVVGSRCVSLHQWYLRISILDLSFLIQCLELGRAELAKETQEIVLKTAPVCILFHWWPSPGLLKVCCLTSVHHFSLSTPRKSHQWGQMSKVIQEAKPWKYSLHGKKKIRLFLSSRQNASSVCGIVFQITLSQSILTESRSVRGDRLVLPSQNEGPDLHKGSPLFEGTKNKAPFSQDAPSTLEWATGCCHNLLHHV